MVQDPTKTPAEIIAPLIESGFTKAMNVSLVSASKEEVQLRMLIGPEHLQPQGLVNGGVLCALVETAGSLGAGLNVAPGKFVVGVENHTSFLRPARSGALLAVARPVHIGGRSQLWTTDVLNEDGEVVATGRLRLMAVGGDEKR
jgi:uncharacterized protein (TIGR00369 family)